MESITDRYRKVEGAWGAARGTRLSLFEDLPSSTLCGREEVRPNLSCRLRGITDDYQDHSFTSRFQSDNSDAASAVDGSKRRRTPRNQNRRINHD
jgi:hypothetical protein